MSSPFDDILKQAHARMPTAEGAPPGRVTGAIVSSREHTSPADVRPLRAIRRARFMTIRELARRAGVSTKTVVEIELGRAVPRFRTIKALSAALGVDPAAVAEFAAVAKLDEKAGVK